MAQSVLNLKHRAMLAAARLVNDVEPDPGPSTRGRRRRGEVREIEGGRGGEIDGDRLEGRDRGERRLDLLGGDVREW